MRQPLFRPPQILLTALLAFWLCSANAAAFETSYWVWHRAAPLNLEETRLCAAQGVATLYWHAATFKCEGDQWRPETALQLPAIQPGNPIRIVPVLRLSLEGSPALGDAAADSLAQSLLEAMRRTGVPEAQIDFDCPDRRLAEYARFLARCRQKIAPARLGATALAGWSLLQSFQALQDSVDSLLPMFYDLIPDLPADVIRGKVQSLIDLPRLTAQLHSWNRCRIPWQAGLPNFSRVTLFDQKGGSRGHLRTWDWDQVSFNPALVLLGLPAPGVTLLRAQKATRIGNTPLAANETLACRWPESSDFTRAVALAKEAGALGTTIFRLPGAGAQSGWSLSHLQLVLSANAAAAPEFRLRLTTHGIELRNTSGADLAPRLYDPAGSPNRGWELEVECAAARPDFREATPGEFANVFGHLEPDSAEPRQVPTALAQRLTYWFGDLRAGQSRQSGLFQLAPGANPAALRWRIPQSAKNAAWQPIDL